MRTPSLVMIACLLAVAGCRKKPGGSKEEATIPEDFPKDLYVYPGTEVLKASKGPNGFSLELHLKGKTTGDAADVYAEEMPKEGWKRIQRARINQNVVLVFTKDNRKATIETAAVRSEARTVLHRRTRSRRNDRR